MATLKRAGAFVGLVLAVACGSAGEDTSSTEEGHHRQCKTCASQGANCGSISDGCGHTLQCGTCTAPQTCGGGGTANVCGCGSCSDGGTLPPPWIDTDVGPTGTRGSASDTNGTF